MLYSTAIYAQQTFEIKGKVYTPKKGAKITEVRVHDNKGKMLDRYVFPRKKFKINIEVGNEYVIFFYKSGFPTKAISFSAVVGGISESELWLNHKFNIYMDDPSASYSEDKRISIERVDWDPINQIFQHSFIGLPKKYHDDYNRSIATNRFDKAAEMVANVVNQFIDLDISDVATSKAIERPENQFGGYSIEDELDKINNQTISNSVEDLRQRLNTKQENLDKLRLKKDMVKLEKEAAELKVYFLDDLELKKMIEKSLNDISSLLENTDKKIIKEEEDIKRIEQIIIELEKRNLELKEKEEQQKTEQKEKEEREAEAKEKEVKKKTDSSPRKVITLKDEGGQDLQLKRDEIRRNENGNLVELYSAEYIGKDLGDLSSPKEKKKEQIKPEVPEEKDNCNREKVTSGKELKFVNVEDSVSHIINALIKNNTPSDEYSYFVGDDEIVVKKYVLQEGIYEVIMDVDCKVQMLRNNTLVTDDVFTEETKKYHAKLSPMQEIELKNYQLSFLKRVSKKGLIFRVQVGALKKPNRNYYVKLLNMEEIDEEFGYGWYNYLIGECNTVTDILKYQKLIREKVPDAYTVSYHNGERIKLREAYRLLSTL